MLLESTQTVQTPKRLTMHSAVSDHYPMLGFPIMLPHCNTQRTHYNAIFHSS